MGSTERLTKGSIISVDGHGVGEIVEFNYIDGGCAKVRFPGVDKLIWVPLNDLKQPNGIEEIAYYKARAVGKAAKNP